MNAERSQVEDSFWLWWVLASTVGFAVAFVVLTLVAVAMIMGLGRFNLGSAEDQAVVGVVVGAVVGASVGIAQRLVLLRFLVSWADSWVLASIVGWTVGLAMGLAVGEAVSEAVAGGAVSGVVSGVVVGASVGIAQWLALRRQVHQAGWWVLASIVGWTVWLAVGFFGLGFFTVLEPAGFFVGFAVGGAITGGVLVWLLRQPIQLDGTKHNAKSGDSIDNA